MKFEIDDKVRVTDIKYIPIEAIKIDDGNEYLADTAHFIGKEGVVAEFSEDSEIPVGVEFEGDDEWGDFGWFAENELERIE